MVTTKSFPLSNGKLRTRDQVVFCTNLNKEFKPKSCHVRNTTDVRGAVNFHKGSRS